MSISDPFEPYQDPGPRYPGMESYSVYVPMRDGVRLAVDVYLPSGLQPGERIPALLYQTRYWRSVGLRTPFRWFLRDSGDAIPFTRKGKAFYAVRGYATVMVDVRGTGASFGISQYPWEAITVQDSAEIIDWIVNQPWSNGRVAGVGVSYLGTTAELLLATRHPALKAVIAKFNHPDSYLDIAMPGGLFNRRFIKAWSELNDALDRGTAPGSFGWMMRLVSQGVSPVNGKAGQAELTAAAREHANNGGLNDLNFIAAFRDQPHPKKGFTLNDQVVMRFRDAIMEGNVPVYGWASWMDAGTGNAALRRFRTFPGPQMALIGAWSHGGFTQSSAYQSGKAPLSPPMEVQRREELRFLDLCLNHPDQAEAMQNTIFFYTMGAETWQKAHTWPPAGVQAERWYLDANGSLSLTIPEEPGQDHYTVNFNASTGTYNRWWELGVMKGMPVHYGDRALQRPYVLGYESAPLETDLEISGNPVVSLRLRSSEPDCAFYVYLEDVFPDGHITCVTEGQLRAVNRKVRPPEEAPYCLLEPYHTFKMADAMPLVPGEEAEITFGLLPVSSLIRKDHRIRIAITGHDESTFPRIPQQGTPEWEIIREGANGSYIDLPVRR